MASNNEEKDLIGCILSEEEEVYDAKKREKRKKLSLHSKEFDIGKQYVPDHYSSNFSCVSTGQVSNPQNKCFFKTQTSIEINGVNVPHTMDYDKYPSIEQMPSFNSIEQIQQRTPRRQNTVHAQPIYMKSALYISDRQIEGRQSLTQTDLEQICGNQAINRKLQNVLEYGDQQMKYLIFLRIESICLKASKDMFGNYTVQKILEIGEKEWKFRIFKALKDHIIELSRNIYGCRVVQKLLEFINDKNELLEYFLHSIRQHINTLCYDQYGNFVLLSCLEIYPKSQLEFFIPYVEESINFMAKQTYGCRIIQKLLELYTTEQTSRILTLLLNIAFQLCFSEFGNYIVQSILKNGPMKEKIQICAIIRDNFEQLSVNKFGSNTVEKYIDYIGPADIIKKLVSYSQNNEYVFYNLSINPYGNYVMKKVLISSDPSLQMLKNIIQQQPDIVYRIKSSDYGQKVGQIMETL